MSQFKTMNINVVNHSQTVIYTELLTLDQHRLRLVIRANSYRDQSHAVIERWSGEAWQSLYNLEGGGLATQVEALYVRPEFAPRILREQDQSTNIRHCFAKDRAFLMGRAAEVLVR